MHLNQNRSPFEIEAILNRCSAKGIEQTVQGAKFICPLPKIGPLAFLHCLFAPCTASQLEDVRDLFGFGLPDEYESFLKLSNGASLFRDAVSIYGIGGNFSRGLSLSDQAAFSLVDMHERFRLSQSLDWSLGWRPVGFIAALQQSYLTLNAKGVFRLRYGVGRERQWGSFYNVLFECVHVADEHFDCDGYIGSDYSSLEESFAALLNSEFRQ